MANEHLTPGGLPEKPLGYRKLTKITSDTTTNAHQEQETREDVSARYKKRVVTSETRESNTSLIEIFEPSAVPAISAALPAAWRVDLPSKVRIRITGVQPAGCADAEEFDGEYILDLIEARPEQCRWELTLPPKCHLYRICLVAVRAAGDAVRLRASFEDSERAPAWAAIVSGTHFGSAASAFDSLTAANPCAGCQWPDNVTAEPIFAERAYISPHPTDEELAIMAAASSSGCTSGGSAGYSILGPRDVPGLSEYTYQLELPAGEAATDNNWTVDKSTAMIVSTVGIQAVVGFKNTQPDYIQLKVIFKVNGVPKATSICIALVKVGIGELNRFLNQGAADVTNDNKLAFLVKPPLGKYDTEHVPGSACCAFQYNGQSAPPEAAKRVATGRGGQQAFTAQTQVTLTAPRQRPTALQHILVGYIQSAGISGTANYVTNPPGKTRVVQVPDAFTVDWLHPDDNAEGKLPCPNAGDPCPTGEFDRWPWYNSKSVKQGQGDLTWSAIIVFQDSPVVAFPAFYNPTNPNDVNAQAPIDPNTPSTLIDEFVLHIGASTDEADLGANMHFFQEAVLIWRATISWPPSATIVSPKAWTISSAITEIPVNVVPAIIYALPPYLQWIPK